MRPSLSVYLYNKYIIQSRSIFFFTILINVSLYKIYYKRDFQHFFRWANFEIIINNYIYERRILYFDKFEIQSMIHQKVKAVAQPIRGYSTAIMG